MVCCETYNDSLHNAHAKCIETYVNSGQEIDEYRDPVSVIYSKADQSNVYESLRFLFECEHLQAGDILQFLRLPRHNRP